MSTNSKTHSNFFKESNLREVGFTIDKVIKILKKAITNGKASDFLMAKSKRDDHRYPLHLSFREDVTRLAQVLESCVAAQVETDRQIDKKLVKLAQLLVQIPEAVLKSHEKADEGVDISKSTQECDINEETEKQISNILQVLDNLCGFDCIKKAEDSYLLEKVLLTKNYILSKQSTLEKPIVDTEESKVENLKLLEGDDAEKSVILAESSGEILMHNKVTLSIFNRKEDSLVGLNFFELMSSYDKKFFKLNCMHNHYLMNDGMDMDCQQRSHLVHSKNSCVQGYRVVYSESCKKSTIRYSTPHTEKVKYKELNVLVSKIRPTKYSTVVSIKEDHHYKNSKISKYFDTKELQYGVEEKEFIKIYTRKASERTKQKQFALISQPEFQKQVMPDMNHEAAECLQVAPNISPHLPDFEDFQSFLDYI
ncbi:unnamed protein product [Moneuplotes crassus]|uniref:Uncharacterized protein n=1 Tax=Euplotes crassus TaxID=5936 RepID=A0AAD1XBL4_EUPCR|nr:unnamed protein product [Moneuplotes crassus]